MALNNAVTTKRSFSAIRQRPHGAALMLVGNFNSDLDAPEGNLKEEDITSTMATLIPEYMKTHLLLRCKDWARYKRKRIMLRIGREVQSWTDYLLGTDHHLFQNVYVRYPRKNSDHFMVLGCLCGADHREHS